MDDSTEATLEEAEELQEPGPEGQEEEQKEEEDKAKPGCICMAIDDDSAVDADVDETVFVTQPSVFKACCINADTRLDEWEMLNKACWCSFCCCLGIGFGEFVHQRLVMQIPFCKCECDDVEWGGAEGWSSCLTSFCCMHLLWHLPPRHRSPVCVFCDEMYGVPHKDESPEQIEKDEKDFEEERIDDNIYNFILGEAFTVFYLKVCGLAINP